MILTELAHICQDTITMPVKKSQTLVKTHYKTNQ